MKELSKGWMIGALISELVLSPVFGLLGGYLFDQHFQTTPWGVLVGFLLGVGGAIKLGLVLKALLKEKAKE
jgi:F0F1-type ATP synthase assembly protein I